MNLPLCWLTAPGIQEGLWVGPPSRSSWSSGRSGRHPDVAAQGSQSCPWLEEGNQDGLLRGGDAGRGILSRGGGRAPGVGRVRSQCCLMVKIAGSREKQVNLGSVSALALDSCGILSLCVSKVRMTITEMFLKRVRILFSHVCQVFSSGPNLEVPIKGQLGIRGGKRPERDGAGGLQDL